MPMTRGRRPVDPSRRTGEQALASAPVVSGVAGARLSRRLFLALTGAGTLGLFLRGAASAPIAVAAIPGGTLHPDSIRRFVTPLLVPPVMPRSGVVRRTGGPNIDTYEISMRQFRQQVLPVGLPATTVWGYGPESSRRGRGPLLHSAPSFTIEAKWNRPVRVTWINGLVDDRGGALPHLLPVDPTLHWANPPGGLTGRDSRPTFTSTPGPYTGPVPIVTHVHGAVDVADDSDGYAEAWYLPDDPTIPSDYARTGRWYDFFAARAQAQYGAPWAPGTATFQYPNRQRAATIWYHDHTLGMTRLNVYTGPAGFYLIRGGPDGDDAVRDARTGQPAVLPGPAPREGEPFPPRRTHFEIPLAIQDRAFDTDGSLFYPDSRAFFDEFAGPFIPASDVSPIWNPEFFGNTIIVNGATWPFMDVQQRRYRFRLLNGCDSRFLILDFSGIPEVDVWQIGSDGGFLEAPVPVTAALGNRVLLGPAERADVIVDFTRVPVGSFVLGNVGPDEPFGGGEPVDDFDVADRTSTGQVMQFRVGSAADLDPSTPPEFLVLPPISPLADPSVIRRLALLEEMSTIHDGPSAALLGIVAGDPAKGAAMGEARMWSDALTETPQVGAVEVWEFYNGTADAHPIHLHDVMFEVVDRQDLVPPPEPMVMAMAEGGHASHAVFQLAPGSQPRPPEPGERGWKDTVIAYPGQVTRVRMRFGTAGQYVWHCHILSHEDNEMMRPFGVGLPGGYGPEPMDHQGGH
jgi:FtsP/CotA-like multicopper oxidase with cupredoxin domain